MPWTRRLRQGWCAVVLLLACSTPLHAQARDRFEVGLGIGVADTDQNAIAGVGTVTWNAAPWLGGIAFRAFLDSEFGMPDFKDGLHYDEASDRQYIVDEAGVPQDPHEQDLWQSAGWDAHVALYMTIQPVPRVHVGGGFAYNGLDSKGGLAGLLYLYATQRTELGIEWLTFEGSNWRFRITFGFWRF